MIPKLRAWDKAHEVMRDVLLIDFISRSVICETDDERNIKLYVTTYELMQSTGVKVMNGKEIFEGDIVTAMSEGIKGTGVVKRRIDGYWFMYPAWQNGQSWKLVVSEQGDTDVEIIGNKFEHPHLLGEE